MRKEIEWLLFESGITSYKISQKTGIAQYTLGKYKKRKSDIGNMSFANAESLYKYYKEVNGGSLIGEIENYFNNVTKKQLEEDLEKANCSHLVENTFKKI